MAKLAVVLGLMVIAGALVSCSGNVNSLPSSQVQEADDIITAPGLGPEYRANVQGAGTQSSWPRIEGVKVILGDSLNPAEVTYRNRIETSPGQTRNNIFWVYLPNVVNDLSARRIEVDVRGVDLPSGITVSEIGQWHGADPARQSKIVIQIAIDQQVPRGDYAFQFLIIIDGQEQGRVPITLTVD